MTDFARVCEPFTMADNRFADFNRRTPVAQLMQRNIAWILLSIMVSGH